MSWALGPPGRQRGTQPSWLSVFSVVLAPSTQRPNSQGGSTGLWGPLRLQPLHRKIYPPLPACHCSPSAFPSQGPAIFLASPTESCPRGLLDGAWQPGASKGIQWRAFFFPLASASPDGWERAAVGLASALEAGALCRCRDLGDAPGAAEPWAPEGLPCHCPGSVGVCAHVCVCVCVGWTLSTCLAPGFRLLPPTTAPAPSARYSLVGFNHLPPGEGLGRLQPAVPLLLAPTPGCEAIGCSLLSPGDTQMRFQ